MIKLQAIGHLGKDAIKNDVNGKTVINFSVCHTEKFTDAQGNKKEKSIWVDCNYWTEKTGILPYLTKGSLVYVDGQPEVRNYTTSDGRTGSSLTLRIAGVQLLGGKQEQSNTTSASQASYQAQSPIPGNSDIVDDLPF